jgi:hypothetical protein
MGMVRDYVVYRALCTMHSCTHTHHLYTMHYPLQVKDYAGHFPSFRACLSFCYTTELKVTAI